MIAATQTDLMKKVREGTFRKDLWFRLAVLTIVIPPLRDRKADIPALVRHFLRTKAAQFEMEVPDVPAPELERLYSHDWPGNVRELEFVIERSLLLSRSKAVGTPLKFEFRPEVEGGAASPEGGWPSLAELEQRISGVSLRRPAISSWGREALRSFSRPLHDPARPHAQDGLAPAAPERREMREREWARFQVCLLMNMLNSVLSLRRNAN